MSKIQKTLKVRYVQKFANELTINIYLNELFTALSFYLLIKKTCILSLSVF